MNNESHVYHHNDPTPVSFDVEVARNTKGFNWTIKVRDCQDKDQLFELLEYITSQLSEKYPKE